MRKVSLLVMLSLICTFFSAEAQDSTSADKGELSITGYVDVYYSYNFNKPKFGSYDRGTSGFQNAGRIFDIKHNQFSVGLAQAKFAYSKGKSEAVIDLTFGPNADLGNFGNVGFGTVAAIKQAYFTYNATDKLSFTAGQFGTHIGYELIDAPLNFNYSLSYLFGNGPFYHTGVKAAYSVSDNFGLMLGVVNGWDAMFDFNDKKNLVAQVYLAPIEGWDVYLNYIGGDDKNGLSFPTIGAPGSELPDSIKTPAHMLDLTTAYQVTDKLKLGLNAAYGFGTLKIDSTAKEGYSNATWFGAALYVNYAVSDVFGIGLRAEHFNDEDGVRYIGAGVGAASYNEITLTGDIKLADGKLFLKPEFRMDFANKDVFLDESGDTPKAKSAQPTLGLAAIYSF